MKHNRTDIGQAIASSDDAILGVLPKNCVTTAISSTSPPVASINRTQSNKAKTLCYRCVGKKYTCSCPGRKLLSPVVLAYQWMDVVVPFYNECSTREREAFHLFRTHTITAISGVLDQSFWHVSVTRSMGSCRAVWHAALAVAAIHERSRICGETELANYCKNRYYDVALCQYGKSIQELTRVISRKQLTYADKEAILIASVLYSAIGKIQGDDGAAHTHARAFVRLFCLWQFWHDCNPPERRGLPGSNILNALFYRFAGHHLVTRTPLPWAILDAPGLVMRSGSRLPYSDKPTTDIGAYYELYAILISVIIRVRALHVNAEQPQRTKSQQRPRTDLLYSCRQAFTNWKAAYPHFIAQFNHAKSLYLLCLQAQVLAIEIFLYTRPSDFGRDWARLAPLFSKGITISQELFALESEGVDRGDKDFDSPTLSFAASACNLLYLICLNSRDRAITRQALSLWKAWPRQDEIWTPSFDTQMLQAILDVEDSGQLRYACTLLPVPGGECIPGGYVCENHRVSCRTLHFFGHRKATLELKTGAEEHLKLQGRAIKLAW